MKNVVVITHNLYTGGITSYLKNLTKYLCSKGFNVDLIYESADVECLEELDKRINIIKIKKLHKIKVLFRVMCSKYRRIFVDAIIKKKKLVYSQIYSLYNCELHSAIEKDYDIGISSEEFFCNEYLALNIRANYKIGWVHPDYNKIDPITDIDKNIFKKLDKIIAVSQKNRITLQNVYPTLADKFDYIENIVDSEKIIKLSHVEIADVDFEFNGMNFLTVCRLDNSSKRIDRIVKCCSFLKKNGINFKWYIVGEGKDRKNIEKWISEYLVDDVLILLGEKKNPYPYFVFSDAFILTSGYEGKPITVEEAKILKCPIIVTKYDAADEQLQKKYGIVIDNDDNSINEQLLDIINEKKIFEIKSNLTSYTYDCTSVYKKIDKLIEYDSKE